MTPRIESFCWRVEQLTGEGGFALVTGPRRRGQIRDAARARRAARGLT